MATKMSKEESFASRQLLENARVKIYEMDLAPRQKTEMHAHPDYVGYMITDGRLRFHYADGISEDKEYKAGQVAYRQAQKHDIENAGDQQARILIIELKK